MNDKKYELIPFPVDGWEKPEVRYAYVKGQWDLLDKLKKLDQNARELILSKE